MLELMEKMLRHVLENGYTQFDDKHSLQIAGLGMGTPGAPILVNITLAIVDNNFVAEFKNVIFLKRCIDGIFCVIHATPEESNTLVSRIYTTPCN